MKYKSDIFKIQRAALQVHSAFKRVYIPTKMKIETAVIPVIPVITVNCVIGVIEN